MSGAGYLFTLLSGQRVLSMVREHGKNLGTQLDAPREMGLLIMCVFSYPFPTILTATARRSDLACPVELR
jgi:hypothetical protein